MIKIILRINVVINKLSFIGSTWQALEPPKGSHVKSLSAGAPWCIWALDARGGLFVRYGISRYQNQAGNEWRSVSVHELEDNSKGRIILFANRKEKFLAKIV